MVSIDLDTVRDRTDNAEKYVNKHNTTFLDFFRFVFNKVLNNLNKEDKNKKVAYTYNPLPENKRERLGEFITEHFKNKAEFAREADLDLSVLVALINNRRCGNALTWKKINDVFERHGIKLPYDLQIKYEVADKF